MNGRMRMVKYDQTREYIIKKAIDLFAARGFRGISIQDIANSTNMSISNIYHYFGNKEGLMLAVLEYSTDKMINNIKEISKLDMEARYLLQTGAWLILSWFSVLRLRMQPIV